MMKNRIRLIALIITDEILTVITAFSYMFSKNEYTPEPEATV